MDDKYKIRNFSDISKILFQEREKTSFWKIFFKSGEISKTNLFFQSINCFAIFLLIVVLIPQEVSGLSVNGISFFGVPVTRVVIAVILYIVPTQLLNFFALNWSDIFETSKKITLTLTVLLALPAVAFLYDLLKSAIDNVKIKLYE